MPFWQKMHLFVIALATAGLVLDFVDGSTWYAQFLSVLLVAALAWDFLRRREKEAAEGEHPA